MFLGGTGKTIAQYPRLSPAMSAGCGLATGTYTINKWGRTLTCATGGIATRLSNTTD